MWRPTGPETRLQDSAAIVERPWTGLGSTPGVKNADTSRTKAQWPSAGPIAKRGSVIVARKGRMKAFLGVSDAENLAASRRNGEKPAHPTSGNHNRSPGQMKLD